MAASILEEKISKIRQQNEEIKRRHEEVEEDKKNAAKLNALVQIVSSTDWPERKEPTEFFNSSRTNNKSKPAKEYHEYPQQYHSACSEGRKVYTFSQGQGPPSDPKYNFLADAEREENNVEDTKNNLSNRGQKHSRDTFRRRPGGKVGMQRNYKKDIHKGQHRGENQPEYEAWRAERNRIDEDRISRQRTAEGNWRREWDNDKAHIVNEIRAEDKIADYVKKNHKDFDKRYHVNGNNYVNYNRSGHRYRGNSKYFYNDYENRSNSAFHQAGHVKNSLSSEERTVVATDKSIKITLNQRNMIKSPVMSVKVNSPSIAGTGRVGPRQRSRVTYSSHSDLETASPDTEFLLYTKPCEDKAKGNIDHNNIKKSSNMRKSPPRDKNFSNKSPYIRKEIQKEGFNENPQKCETESSQKEYKDLQKSYQFMFKESEENITQLLQNNEMMIINEQENNIISFDQATAANVGVKQYDHFNASTCKKNVCANQEDEYVPQNSDTKFLLTSNNETKIEICEINKKVANKSEELQNVHTPTIFECKTIRVNVTSVENTDKKNTEIFENLSCDNIAKKTVIQN